MSPPEPSSLSLREASLGLPEDPKLDRALSRLALTVKPGAALRAVVGESSGPVSRPSTVARVLPVLAASGVLVGLSALLAGPSAGVSWAVLGATGALFLVTLGVVFYRGPLGLGPPRALRWALTLVALFLFGAVSAVGARPRTETPSHDEPATNGSKHQLRGASNGAEGSAIEGMDRTNGEDAGGLGGRGVHGLVVAALAGLAIVYGARRTAPVAPTATGAAGGLAAGLVGAMALQAQGPGSALAQVPPVALGVCLGALLGRRFFAP
ncbi:MAG: hypothetical protein HY909_30120 [Deltaproteobacteria bacterium]|nr:hypothetical protein [Deltaproteobacteria bacterium]